MMARLKSLKIKITFQKTYQKNPLTITHNGSDVQSIMLDVNKLGQEFKFNINGFVPNESQDIKCIGEWQSQTLKIKDICFFDMQNNQYVTNEPIQNYDTIYFNGTLTLKFTKSWCEHNILAGSRLEEYVAWQKIDLPIVNTYCVGDSYTLGYGVGDNENWPALLNMPNFNFGVPGISHDGCLQNIMYVTENNPDTKQIICLLPEATRKLVTYNFLDSNGSVPITINQSRNIPKEYEEAVEDARSLILNENHITKDWIKTVNDIISFCKGKNVKCLISTWSQHLHKYIPEECRLPVFPDLEMFDDRATDGQHPHKKHYEYFVQKILPYVDKYTT